MARKSKYDTSSGEEEMIQTCNVCGKKSRIYDRPGEYRCPYCKTVLKEVLLPENIDGNNPHPGVNGPQTDINQFRERTGSPSPEAFPIWNLLLMASYGFPFLLYKVGELEETPAILLTIPLFYVSGFVWLKFLLGNWRRDDLRQVLGMIIIAVTIILLAFGAIRSALRSGNSSYYGECIDVGRYGEQDCY